MTGFKQYKYRFVWLSLLFFVVAAVTAADAESLFRDKVAPQLRIIYSGRMMGNIEPCG